VKKIIEFIADSKEYLEILEKPYPSSKKLPDWICETPSYINGNKSVDDFGDPTSTIKKCMPVWDSITAGYHIPLHCDVWIENKGQNDINIRWAWDSIKVVDIQKEEQLGKYPIPNDCYDTPFKFINPWIVKTPKKWSSLFIHPLNYDELPFRCIPAIVDTDKFPAPVNFVFFLKKDFRGLISKGTPIIQVIPIQKQTFKSSFSFDHGFFKRQCDKAHTVFFDRYKKFFRDPKKYEQGDVKKCPLAFLGL
jgi:hypothetical protein